jgi:hypothetical protein
MGRRIGAFLLNLIFLLSVKAVCLSAPSANLPPQITLRVPLEEAVEGREVSLYITVVHSQKQQVDPSRFSLDGKPLHVSCIQTENVAPKGLFQDGDPESFEVSRFVAKMPAKKAGVYTVGPVTVTVDGAKYTSGAITINIQGAEIRPSFRLEAKVIAPPKIYPGEEIQFEYRIYFEQPMQLFREDLPLLEHEGFLNIGSPQVTAVKSGAGNVQVITQKARALSPKLYEFSRSIIEGMAVEESENERRCIPPLLRAEAPPISLTVTPLPQDAPQEFDGTIGVYTWRPSLVASDTAVVGEKVQVEYRVSGRGPLSSVKFPPLERLLGLQEAFWTDGEPPVGEEKEGTKVFVLTLRPKRPGKISIPGFSVASFDPIGGRYITSTVAPLMIQVTGNQEETQNVRESLPSTTLAPPFDLSTSNVTAKDIAWWMAAIVATSFIGIAYFQVWCSRRIRRQEKNLTSRQLFYKAITARSQRKESLQLLKKALYLRVYEVGLTKSIGEIPEDLVGEGLISEVRGLLLLIDKELYYQASSGSSLQEIYDGATSLYHQLRQLADVHGGV